MIGAPAKIRGPREGGTRLRGSEMETNPVRLQIQDLKQRVDALRGYL
jgi:hypothetical protein